MKSVSREILEARNKTESNIQEAVDQSISREVRFNTETNISARLGFVGRLKQAFSRLINRLFPFTQKGKK